MRETNSATSDSLEVHLHERIVRNQTAGGARLEPLAHRSGAKQVVKLWECDRPSEVMALLKSRRLDSQQRLDASMMDQRFRWQNGLDCRAEVYVAVIRSVEGAIPDDVVCQLAMHEFQLHKHYSPDNCPSFAEFARRFPPLLDLLDDLEPTVMHGIVPKTAPLESQEIHDLASDPTQSVQSEGSATHKVESIEKVELTEEPKHTNIVPKVDGNATVLDIDLPVTCSEGSIEKQVTGRQSQPDSSHLVDIFVTDNSDPSELAACRPFDQLPASLVRSLEERMQSITFEVDEFVMREGDRANGLFLLQDGIVAIRSSSDSEQERVIARVQGPAILGEMALLTDEPRTADVVAETPITGRVLPLKVFEDMALRYPVISRVLTQLFADRLGKRGHDALAGKQLDRFLIRNRLGRGGMAIVYRATDTRNNADVALKMMSHRLVYDHRALRLFQSEAQIIEAFDHPNIVKTVGRFKAFRSMFIAMEYCEGVSLDEIVKSQGGLKPDRFRIIMAQLASALDYAHSQNVVHRDIKPSNVIVSNDDVVKLMDFGLANPIDNTKNDGFVAGTPRFMAPEQAAGGTLTGKADVFALGCTAYRVLTGQNLIDGTTVSEAVEQHKNWRLPDLSQFDTDIAEFFTRSLQVDVAQRDLRLSDVSQQWSRKW